MAASNSTGAIMGTRMGCDVVAHTIPFAYSNSTAFKALTIPASAQKPVIVELSFATALTFNSGTTAKVGIGTTTSANELVNAQDIIAVTTGKTLALTQVLGLLVADTDIYLKFTETGTAATAGNGYVIVKLYTVNTASV